MRGHAAKSFGLIGFISLFCVLFFVAPAFAETSTETIGIGDPPPTPDDHLGCTTDTTKGVKPGTCKGECTGACVSCKVYEPRCLYEVVVEFPPRFPPKIPPDFRCKKEMRVIDTGCTCGTGDGKAAICQSADPGSITDCFDGDAGDFCKKEGSSCLGDQKNLCSGLIVECNDGKGGKYSRGGPCPAATAVAGEGAF